MEDFTTQKLSGFDGKEGRPAYVARDGKVYDVSASKLWKSGEHMKRHQAGRDLSVDFTAAPHGPEMLDRVPLVGTLVAETTASEDKRVPPWLAGLLKRYPFLERHPHPMFVHYPIVFMFSAPGFSLLALLTGQSGFGVTAFHCLGAGLLFIPIAILTGLYTWWLNYLARPLLPVLIKLWTSIAMLLVAGTAFYWRFTTPDILSTLGGARLLYLALLGSLIPMVGVIGWFGATLTFPVKKS